MAESLGAVHVKVASDAPDVVQMTKGKDCVNYVHWSIACSGFVTYCTVVTFIKRAASTFYHWERWAAGGKRGARKASRRSGTLEHKLSISWNYSRVTQAVRIFFHLCSFMINNTVILHFMHYPCFPVYRGAIQYCNMQTAWYCSSSSNQYIHRCSPLPLKMNSPCSFYSSFKTLTVIRYAIVHTESPLILLRAYIFVFVFVHI